jgi:hypothetical protein
MFADRLGSPKRRINSRNKASLDDKINAMGVSHRADFYLNRRVWGFAHHLWFLSRIKDRQTSSHFARNSVV